MHQPTVNLWLLNVQAESVALDQILRRLASPQRRRVNTFQSRKRQREFGVGRLLLEYAIANELDGDWRQFSIVEKQGSVPLVDCYSDAAGDMKVTISHSRDWVSVIAWWTQEEANLGIDIESMRLDWTDVKASYFCNTRQLAHSACMSTTERQIYLTRLWTQKEAFFKAQHESMFNEKTKAVDFADNRLMRSASLSKDYQLSLYCSLAVNIDTKFVGLDSSANIIDLSEIDGAPKSVSWS